MSGNIHDTNVSKITEEVNELFKDIDDLVVRNENVSAWSDTLQKKHKYLYKTSSTLFNYILKNYKNPNFDAAFFDRTLNMMLHQISQIQRSNVSQNSASETIGTHLATTFIPHLKK